MHEIVLKLLKTGGQKALVCFHGKITALHTVLNRNSEAERKKAEIVHRPQLVNFHILYLHGLVRRAASGN